MTDDRDRAAGSADQPHDNPISWRVARPGTPVFGSDGTLVGTLHEVAADDNEDIFHGLVVDRGGADPLVLVPRDDVSAIEDSRIDVSLDHDAAAGLEPYSTAGASDAPLGGLDT